MKWFSFVLRCMFYFLKKLLEYNIYSCFSTRFTYWHLKILFKKKETEYSLFVCLQQMYNIINTSQTKILFIRSRPPVGVPYTGKQTDRQTKSLHLHFLVRRVVFKDCYIQIFAKQITAKVLYGNNPRKHLWLMNLKQNFTAGKLLKRGSGSRWVVRLTSRYSLFCPGMQRYANVYRFVCEFGYLFFYGNILKSSLYIPSNVSKGVVPHKKNFIFLFDISFHHLFAIRIVSLYVLVFCINLCILNL